MRKLAALAILAALAGCAYPDPRHVQALNALVGKSETDLLRTYGVPNRTYDSAGHRFLAYSRSRIDSFPGAGGFGYGGFGYGGFGYGYGGYGPGFGGFGPEIVQRDCDTTFELGGGKVLTWSLRGNDC